MVSNSYPLCVGNCSKLVTERGAESISTLAQYFPMKNISFLFEYFLMKNISFLFNLHDPLSKPRPIKK